MFVMARQFFFQKNRENQRDMECVCVLKRERERGEGKRDLTTFRRTVILINMDDMVPDLKFAMRRYR